MKIELLAPAGDIECLKAAIRAGADAVYFGYESFNARANVENFNKENLREAVRFAHLFGVKMYMALNILITNNEFEHTIEIVRFARECKVDAFIVQDIGLATLLKNAFPNIELHASTQMGISSLEGALFLKKMGFSRIVLARETSLVEIKRIKENVDIEIEYFVQGALCVGYSGNCYFSSLVEGASGNRGKCKQLCRLPYLLQSGNIKKHGYLLSTKDLCMVPVLEELAKAGVTSFKIEGRARRSAYVAGTVKTYRRVIDEAYQYNDSDIIKLKSLFNRGDYSCGYLKNEKMIYPQLNSHLGVEVGKVEKFKRGNKFNEVVVRSSHEIIRGDLLQCSSEATQGTISVYDVKSLGEQKYYITTTNVVEKGAIVRRLVDKKLEDEVLADERKLSVKGCFFAKQGEKPMLSLSVGGVQISVIGEDACQCAKSQVLDKEECFKQLSKMGENFSLDALDFVSDGVFLRKAQLNELRRKALDKLENAIIQENEKHLCEDFIHQQIGLDDEKVFDNNEKIYVFNDLSKLKENLDLPGVFVLSPNEYRKDEIVSLAQGTSKMIFLDTPVYAEKKEIDFLKDIISASDNIGVVANNYYALGLTTPDKTIIGSEMNVVNSHSINLYKSLGYSKIILNKEKFFELDVNDKRGLFMHACVNEKLIYFKHCPIKEHIGGNCGQCRYKEGISYTLAGKKYILKRNKTASCLFYLQGENAERRAVKGFGAVIEI